MSNPSSSLQHEIHQSVPFASKSEEAILALWRTADRLRANINAVLDPFGITGQQYNVLRILRGAEPEGLPTLAIAERMIEHSPGITRMVDRLERKGWVCRERRSEDRRCVICRVTPDGLELMQRLDEHVRVADDALTFLGAATLDELIATLGRIRERLA
jgi:DNA-binding MarR family transcriptional regulator